MIYKITENLNYNLASFLNEDLPLLTSRDCYTLPSSGQSETHLLTHSVAELTFQKYVYVYI